MQVTHVTIYRHARNDQRQGGGLCRNLRQGGKRTFGTEQRGRLQGKRMIDNRSEAVELRKESRS